MTVQRRTGSVVLDCQFFDDQFIKCHPGLSDTPDSRPLVNQWPAFEQDRVPDIVCCTDFDIAEMQYGSATNRSASLLRGGRGRYILPPAQSQNGLLLKRTIRLELNCQPLDTPVTPVEHRLGRQILHTVTGNAVPVPELSGRKGNSAPDPFILPSGTVCTDQSDVRLIQSRLRQRLGRNRLLQPAV